MSCNLEFFKTEEELVKSTWLAPIINGDYPDVDYYFYTASKTHRTYIDKKNHYIYVDSNDNWYNTFKKTKLAFKKLFETKEYDYIVRVNLSTYVNLSLCIKTIEMYLDKIKTNQIWGQDLCNHTGTYYLIGKFLIFPKTAVYEIINSDPIFETQQDADDYVYGCIYNDSNKFRTLPPCYAVPKLYDTPFTIDISDPKKNPEVYKKYIAISYRFDGSDYASRKTYEFAAAHELHNILKDNVATVTDVACLASNINNIVFVHGNGYTEYTKNLCIGVLFNNSIKSNLSKLDEISNMFNGVGDLYIIVNNDDDIYNYIDYFNYLRYYLVYTNYDLNDSNYIGMTQELYSKTFSNAYDNMMFYDGTGYKSTVRNLD